MSRTKVILLAIAALVVGIVVGAASGAWFSAWTFGTYSVTSAAAGVSTKVMALEGIREGRLLESTELLESLLDADLIILDAFQKDGPSDRLLRPLRMANEYREKFPRRTADPEVDAAVAEALRKAPMASK